jgi:mRNA-degrading endonuclease RelE of RelBE toxin-antitoxin system
VPYTIVFGPRAAADLRSLRKHKQVTIRDHINRFLLYQPTQEQGPRIKALVQPAIAQYRLRVGDFRVYYDVDETTTTVSVIRIVRKGIQTTAQATGTDDGEQP